MDKESNKHQRESDGSSPLSLEGIRGISCRYSTKFSFSSFTEESYVEDSWNDDRG